MSLIWVISFVIGLNYIYDKKRYPLNIMFWIFIITFFGAIISLYFYFDGTTPIYHYKIVELFGDIKTKLEVSNQCASYVCVGNCFSQIPINGVTCIRGMSNNHNNDQCVTQCSQYYMKYAAIQTYVLENVDEPDKKLYLNIKTEPKYNSDSEAKQIIFPLLIGKEGYLDWTTEMTIDESKSIPWINYDEHESEYYFGSTFAVFCFGILLLISTIYCTYIYFEYYKKRKGYDVIV